MSTYSAFRASSGKGGETEIAFAEVTTNVSIVSTSVSAPTDVIALPPTYYDGAPIILEFFAPAYDINNQAGVIFLLMDGSTVLCRISDYRNGSTGGGGHSIELRPRITPTPGIHTFKIGVMRTSAAGTIYGGVYNSGSGLYGPIQFRALRVSPDAGSGPARAEVQLDYAERVANVTVTTTPTLVVNGNSIVCDGVTPIKVEFYCDAALNPSNQYMIFELWDGGTVVGRIGHVGTPGQQVEISVAGAKILTPTAGVHQYNVRAWTTSGNGSLQCAATWPTWMRVTAVSPGVLGVAPLASEFKIYDSLLAAPAASFDVQNIPAIYSHLKLVLQARGTAGGLSGHYLRFNGDAGANYDYQYSQANGGVHDQAGGAAQSEMNVTGVGAAASANMFDTSELILYNYASTAMFKSMLGSTSLFYTLGTVNTYRSYRWAFLWRSLAAVNRIQIIADGTLVNLAAGSRLQIYGIL